MAPQNVISGSRAIRRTRKRQSRHAGKPCKGCTAVSNPVTAWLLPNFGSEEEVISLKQDGTIVLQTSFFTAPRKPAEAIREEDPLRPASLKNHDFKDGNEGTIAGKQNAGVVVPTHTCTTTAAILQSENGAFPGEPPSAADHDLKASTEHEDARKEDAGVLSQAKSEELSDEATTLVRERDSAANEATEWSELKLHDAPSLVETNIEQSQVRSMSEATESVSMVAVEEEEAEEQATAPECTPLSRKPLSRKNVHFDLESTSMHEVIPYAEIYGAHPRTFVFNRDSIMIPAARGGFVSAAALEEEEVEEPDDDDDSDCESCEDDGGWESWLLERENSDDDSYEDIDFLNVGGDSDESELERRSSMEITHGTCLPAFDDETGWESWLEATLGSAQEDLFSEPI